MGLHHTSSLSAFALSPDALSAIQTALETVRGALRMEVAYLSEFVNERAVFRAVSAPGLEAMIQPSQSMDLREVYCKHILDGGLPRLMPDTGAHRIARDLPITQAIPIASHLSVPVHRVDGSVFGMFCFLSRTTRPDLTERDLHFVEAHALKIGQQLAGQP